MGEKHRKFAQYKKFELDWLEENNTYQFVVLVCKLHLLEMTDNLKVCQGTVGFDASLQKKNIINISLRTITQENSIQSPF